MAGQRIAADKRMASRMVNEHRMGEPANGYGTDKRMNEIPLQDLTYRIIGVAMRVHNQLGPGLKEIMYQRALSSALTEAGISFEEEKPFQITLEDRQVGLIFLDHFVEGSVVVEDKAFSHLLTKEEVAQVITYLAVSEAPVGLLLNFGRSKLEYKRILPPRKFQDWRTRAARYAWRPEEAAKANPIIRSSSVDRADVTPQASRSSVASTFVVQPCASEISL